MHHNTRIIVGLSGGVDSAVAALLLKEQGYDVTGVFMKNWDADDTDDYCAAAEDAADAQAVANILNIPFHTISFAKTYWDKVFEYFLEEYHAGNTPTPDILCNKEIKFKAFLDYALAQGADYIATGHYVRRTEQGHLLKGKDPNKDQSYFLHALTQAQISKALFPLGDYEKPTVRALAKKAGFTNANKKDSTGICFIGERKFTAFLKEYLPAQPGPIETPTGVVLGRHEGLMYHTIGQRKGLGLGGQKNAPEAPWYVIRKDLARNVLVVDQGKNNPGLFHETLLATHAHWIAEIPKLPKKCTAKIRYRQTDQACTLTIANHHTLNVHFQQPQRAITPGQSVVFYEGDHCLGGAVIQQALDG